MGNDIEVVQGLLIFAVTEEGADLHVDVYGGESNVCGSIRFTFVNRRERSEMSKLLERWCVAATPVTYISAGATISLQNDRALFGAQLKSTPRR